MQSVPPHIPPEWAPQAAVWAGWPRLPEEWSSAYEGAKDEIESFLKTLALVTPVKITCGSRAAYGDAHARFGDHANISLHTVLSGDIWVRDTGPIFGTKQNQLVANLFRFNGWGGKYIMPGDDMTAGGISSAELVQRTQHDFILEGGAIEIDGDGRLITTRQCLLNPNRNPGWAQANAEAALRDMLGVTDIIWLDQGLNHDHTDGHIDNITRFISPGRVICQTPSGPDDPNADILKTVEADLRRAGLDLVTVPSPGLITDESGKPLPASHMNFLMSNDHLFLPVFEDKYSAEAISIFDQVLPDTTIIPLPARHILSGGGAFHCMTQQVPKV